MNLTKIVALLIMQGACAYSQQVVNLAPTSKNKFYDESSNKVITYYKGTQIESPFGYLGSDEPSCFITVTDKNKDYWYLFKDDDCDGTVNDYVEHDLKNKLDSNAKSLSRKDNPAKFEELDKLFAEYKALALNSQTTYIP